MLRIVYGGVFDRHPQAQLVIGHLGEMLPFYDRRTICYGNAAALFGLPR